MTFCRGGLFANFNVFLMLRRTRIIPVYPLLVLSLYAGAQNITSYRDDTKKWGFKKDGQVFIEAQYDSVFGFDPTQKIALVSNLNPKKNFINPLTRELKKAYDYFYITTDNKKICLHMGDKTVTEFPNQQKLQKEYHQDLNFFQVFYDGKFYLMNKNGTQVTATGFEHIYFTPEPAFFITETKDKNGQTYLGLINGLGKIIIQSTYSGITVNTKDSLIICCTAGIKYNGSDDVYNYKGEKVTSNGRHIDYATKSYIMFKIYDPVIAYIIHLNQQESEEKEKTIKCDKVHYLEGDEIAIKQGKDWYLYNVKSDKKANFDPKSYPAININE